MPIPSGLWAGIDDYADEYNWNVGANADRAKAVCQRLCDARDASDWTAFAAQYHPDGIYEFVGQAVTQGRDNIAEYERSTHDPAMQLRRDLWTADDSGRVWWRYTASWTDAESGEVRHTSGASTAAVTDGLIVRLTSWIDLSFALPQ